MSIITEDRVIFAALHGHWKPLLLSRRIGGGSVYFALAEEA